MTTTSPTAGIDSWAAHPLGQAAVRGIDARKVVRLGVPGVVGSEQSA